MRTEQKPILAIAALAAAFLLACVILPFLNQAGTLIGLDGNIGTIDHWDIWSVKDPFTMAFYAFGDLLCHQEQSRTFILNGNEMFLCSRDMGLLIGFLIGLSFSLLRWSYAIALDRKRGLAYLAMIAVTPIEWCIERYSDIDIAEIRLITGVITGSAIALALVYLINKEMGGGDEFQ